MTLTILGIILLISPFALIILFKDKVRAFVYILGAVIAFQTFIGVITQGLHVFTYKAILTINIVIFLGIVWFIISNRNKINPETERKYKFD